MSRARWVRNGLYRLERRQKRGDVDVLLEVVQFVYDSGWDYWDYWRIGPRGGRYFDRRRRLRLRDAQRALVAAIQNQPKEKQP